jgi:hypothetical protein
MIGQHPDLAGLPELKLFCCPTIGELEASLPQSWKERGVIHRSPGLIRALAQCEFGEQTAASLRAAQLWLHDRLHWSGSDVLDVLLRRLDPRAVVEKSPDNVLTDVALTRMAAAYPRARYLHVTRHPVTTQRSIEAHRARAIGRRAQKGEPMSGIASWYEIHRRILYFASSLPDDRYLRVRAEDVLNDGDSQLLVIAIWLGIRTDAAAIESMHHPEQSPFARPAQAANGIVAGSDFKFLDDPIPRRVEIPSDLDPPEGWVADPSIWPLVVDVANGLGYFHSG